MQNFDMSFITPILTGVVVSIISSLLSVHLALKKFYSEKWWERKSIAYMAIIEALHHVREHADTNLVFAIKNVDIPSYGDEELKRKLEASMAALRMHRDFGTLVVSEDAIDLMNKLFGELDGSTQTNDWQFHLEMKLKAIDCCLPEMRRIARADLKLK